MSYDYRPYYSLEVLLRDYLVYNYYFDLHYTEVKIALLMDLSTVSVSHIVSAFKKMDKSTLDSLLTVAKVNYEQYCKQHNLTRG